MSTGPTVTIDTAYATVDITSGGATVTVEVPETTVSIAAPGPQGPAGTGAEGYILQAYDTTDQTAADTTTAYPIKLGTVDISDGITVANNGSGQPTRITFANDGDYNIQFSIQFQNSSASETHANVWFRKNGVDIADSNSQVTVPKKHGADDGSLILALNLIVSVGSSDYVELYWQTESTTVSIQSLPAGTTPTTPATPSVIVTATVNRYLEVGPAGPGVASGGTTGQVLTKASATDYDTTWTTPTKSGLVFQSNVTISNGSSSGVSIPNIFSSSYTSYKLILTEASSSVNTYLALRLAANGSADSTSNSYYRRGVWMKATTIEASADVADLCFLGFIKTSGYLAATGEFLNPNLSTTTAWTFNVIDANSDSFIVNGRHTVSASYDGLFLYLAAAGTFSAKLQVFGYNK